MPRCSDGTLNRGLVHVKCALSNTDLKDPEEENLRGPATHRYPAYRKEIPTKPTPKIGCTGPIPGTERQRNVLTPASANAKKKTGRGTAKSNLGGKFRYC